MNDMRRIVLSVSHYVNRFLDLEKHMYPSCSADAIHAILNHSSMSIQTATWYSVLGKP